jgi:hypothetical protein
MSNRSARNLLGRIEDKRAYAPPKTVHGANSKAAVMPTPFRHDDLSPMRKNAVPPPTPSVPSNILVIATLCCRVGLTTSIPDQPSYKVRVPGLAKTSIERKNFSGLLLRHSLPLIHSKP